MHGKSELLLKRFEVKNLGMLPRDFPCDILMKNMADFCSSLQEAKGKIFGSIP